MRTQASWDEQQRALEAARVLAEFANLEPEGVANFRAKHSDFVPTLWWTKTNNVPWIRERDLLRQAWTAGFPADLTLKLATTRLFGVAHLLASAGVPDVPSPFLTAQMPTEAIDSVEGRALMGLAPNPRILAPDKTDITKEVKSRVESGPQIWSYQHAVLFLHVNSWRAKTCEWCGRRFIGEHSQARFCSFGTVVDGNETTCFWAHRKKYKNENWIEHSDSVNARRKREYRSKKGSYPKEKKSIAK